MPFPNRINFGDHRQFFSFISEPNCKLANKTIPKKSPLNYLSNEAQTDKHTDTKRTHNGQTYNSLFFFNTLFKM